MKADDSPTLHVRFLEPMAGGEYHLVLEVHSGKRPVRYKALSIRGGYIGPTKHEYADNILEGADACAFRRFHKTNIFVPAAVARDDGPDVSLTVCMRKSAVILLRTRRHCLYRKTSISIDSSMAVD